MFVSAVMFFVRDERFQRYFVSIALASWSRTPAISINAFIWSRMCRFVWWFDFVCLCVFMSVCLRSGFVVSTNVFQTIMFEFVVVRLFVFCFLLFADLSVRPFVRRFRCLSVCLFCLFGYVCVRGARLKPTCFKLVFVFVWLRLIIRLPTDPDETINIL